MVSSFTHFIVRDGDDDDDEGGGSDLVRIYLMFTSVVYFRN